MSGYGYVVADGCPDSESDEQAMTLAAEVALAGAAPGHRDRCRACKLLGTAEVACAGILTVPIAQGVEEWLIHQLPDELESVPGFLLKKAIADHGYEGAGARDLRARHLIEAPGPYEKHFGPFFRRFTVSTDQLLEELLCAGDIQPPHALTILVHLGALLVDGKRLVGMEEAFKLGEIVEEPASRRARTECTVEPEAADAPPVREMKALVRALWAAFVLDVELRLFEPAEADTQ